EWETKRLGEIAQIKKGSMITEKDVVLGTIPVIAGGQKPAYYHNTANRTGKTITVSASGAYAGFVALYNQPIFASDCSTISESSHYSIDFIYYYLVFNQNVIYNAQTGGAQPHCYPTDLMTMQIDLPLLEEQRAIAAVLSDMDAEIRPLEQRRDKTIAIKQGMMQQLLTGKVRLLK
ncbi:restriction endonuclease subunit S, partial [Candidatus Poribacteria bacterium]|nr:restriction endonuclease subunit S [Candidatus Poribacteria bacterium]